MQQKIVLIGGPGTGKSSVLNELITRGYFCMPEVSREVTLQAQKKGIDQLFLTEPLLFSDLLLKGREQQYLNAAKSSEKIVFFDRGIPDVHAYLNFTNTTQYLAENVTLYTDATFTSTIIRFRSSATSGPNELDILYLDNIIITGYTHTFLDVSVNASSDDAEEDTSTGVMDLTSSDLEICDDTGNQYVGVRFDNITIPPGSTINRSYIQFSSDADDNTALTVTITGIDADAEQLGNFPVFVAFHHVEVEDRPVAGRHSAK